MKYIVIVGDGMADYPTPELGGRTPLEVADTPNLDWLATHGRMGIIQTVPPEMEPDSSIANMAILGYDPRKYHTGRGPLEAGAMGIHLGNSDVAFRCNLVTVKDGVMVDYSAGHLTTEEGFELLKEVAKLDVGEFYPGLSYRHIFILRNTDFRAGCSPPHNIMGEPISNHMIPSEAGEIGKRLNDLMIQSQEVLSDHPINLRRRKEGKNPASMIWLWSPGPKPQLQPFKERYGISGAMISAVYLIKGIGVYAGMEIVEVPGATGYYDTNYEGKADYALIALERNDFVFVHVEAPDEAGHEGSAERKVQVLEDFDRRLVGRLLDRARDCTIAVLPDHPTPVSKRLHMPDPVPFVIYRPGEQGDGLKFSEQSGKQGSMGFIKGPELMVLLLKRKTA